MSQHNDLQRTCFTWAWNNHPQLRGRIYSINQNASSGRQGSFLKGLGFNRGIWDMVIAGKYDTIWIEFKVAPDKLSKEQIAFSEVFRGDFRVVHKFEEFQKIIIEEVI